MAWASFGRYVDKCVRCIMARRKSGPESPARCGHCSRHLKLLVLAPIRPFAMVGPVVCGVAGASLQNPGSPPSKLVQAMAHVVDVVSGYTHGQRLERPCRTSRSRSVSDAALRWAAARTFPAVFRRVVSRPVHAIETSCRSPSRMDTALPDGMVERLAERRLSLTQAF